MEYANRKFRNNRTGEIVKVIDTFENIAILENKQKVDVRSLSDTSQYTEEIDPSSFFNTQGAYNVLAEKIKNIPTHMMNDEPEEIVTKFGGEVNPLINESAIVMTTEEDEKAELARKYGVDVDNTAQLERQQQSFAKLLGEDSEDLPVVKPFTPEEPVIRVEADREEIKQNQQPIIQQTNHQPIVEDPIIAMFKRAKRNVEFSVNLEINNKIPRLDFIEMMEDSYEVSIIDFLSDEFTKEVLSNPEIIKESIKNKIKEIVYGVNSLPTPVNPQITDSVTQVNKDVKVEKPKTTRRPRTKKETTKND
jgi:hypothetical protein